MTGPEQPVSCVTDSDAGAEGRRVQMQNFILSNSRGRGYIPGPHIPRTSR